MVLVTSVVPNESDKAISALATVAASALKLSSDVSASTSPPRASAITLQTSHETVRYSSQLDLTEHCSH